MHVGNVDRIRQISYAHIRLPIPAIHGADRLVELRTAAFINADGVHPTVYNTVVESGDLAEFYNLAITVSI